MARIVWTKFEKQLVSDSIVQFLVDQPALTNKQVFASAQHVLPYQRRGKVTDQRVFAYKALIKAARAAADKVIADRKKVVAAKPPEPTPEPQEPPARKLDTLGEVFELFLDALADRIIQRLEARPLAAKPEEPREHKLEDFFGGEGFGRGRPRRGADLLYRLDLEFREAILGCTKTISIERSQACSTCHGSGAKDGKAPKRCSSCQGRGKVRQ
jgi:hypothetical protein